MARKGLIYARISRDELGTRTGVENQERLLRRLAAQENITVVDTIVENDVSATRGDREGFQRLLDRIRRRDFDVLLGFSMERLARKRIDRANLMDECIAGKVDLLLVNGGLQALSQPGVALVADIMGSLATAETAMMSLRLREGYRGRVHRGLHVPRQRVFGYQVGNLKSDPTEGPIVLEIFERVRNGDAIAAIARDLRKRGVVSTKGNTISRASLHVMLENPRYTGIQEYRVLERDRSGKETGRRLVRYVEELEGLDISDLKPEELTPLPTEGKWDVIVPRDLWQQVQLQRAAPQLRPVNAPTQKWLLAGVARCGECGGKIGTGGGGQSQSLYICRDGGDADPPHRLGRTIKNIDLAITEVVLRVLAAAESDAFSSPGSANANLEHERTLLQVRRKALANSYALGHLDEDAYAEATSALRNRLNEIDSELTAALGRSEVTVMPLGRPIEELREAWSNLDVPARKRILGELFEVRMHRIGRGRPKHPLQGIELTPKFGDE